LLPLPPSPDSDGISFDSLEKKIKDIINPDDCGVYAGYLSAETLSSLKMKLKKRSLEAFESPESELWMLILTP